MTAYRIDQQTLFYLDQPGVDREIVDDLPSSFAFNQEASNPNQGEIIWSDNKNNARLIYHSQNRNSKFKELGAGYIVQMAELTDCCRG
tara:strand:+ start:5562 stop:5825 length:264 start_codon:yes stop_codon:yes gene_type:complete